MKKFMIFLIAVFAGVVSGCATLPMASLEDDALAKRFVTAPDRSLIYLYRNEFFGGAVPFLVSIDGQVAGQTIVYTFFKWDVPPGEHVIKSHSENPPSLLLVTKPGKAHFVRQEIKMGVWMPRSLLYEVSEQEGIAAINECKLVKSDVYDAAKKSSMAAESKVDSEKQPSTEAPFARKKSKASVLAKITEGAAPLPVRAEDTASEPTVKPEPIPQNIQRSGYTLEYETMVSSLTKGAFDSAFAQADTLYQKSQKTDGAKQNQYLSLLERGKVALAARKFDQSIADLQEAEKRFLTIEGTISLIEGAGSILTDDTAMEYEAEMHEKLMISPYLMLAYLSKGDFNGAIVERNRTITKINQYIEEKPDERAYLENPFARYLTAIMYEMEDKKDDAKIEYKKLKWDQEIVRIDSNEGKTTDLVILVDVGLAPQKFQKKWGPMPIPGVGVIGFAYAEYAPTPTEVTTCNIYLNEKSIGNANLLYDLENTVLTQYDKDKPALQAKIVARMTSKAAAQFAAKMVAKEVLKRIPFASLFANIAIDAAGAAWMANEQADLRGWLSLPKQIKYLRVNGLEPGEHTIKIDYGCGVETNIIRVEKDKINIAYFAYAK